MQLPILPLCIFDDLGQWASPCGCAAAHAYAVTIHRSQGSEYAAVVIPLTMGFWMMLQRNLLYIAVTRAKKLVMLAGSRRALAVAVRTRGTDRRHTALGYRLRA